MNLIEYAHKQNFPFNAETLNYMQGQLLLLQQLSLVNGSQYIIDGCIENAGQVSSGKVVIAGEILDFEAGPLGTDVVVVETQRSKTFKDNVIRPYYKDRVAKFGSAGTTYAWANFERNDPANGILKRMREAEELVQNLEQNLENLLNEFNSHTHNWEDIQNKPTATVEYAGSIDLGDIGAGPNAVTTADNEYTITIPNMTNNNYHIVGAMVGLSTSLNDDNDVCWVIGQKSATTFKLAVRDITTTQVQNLRFEFVIIKIN